MKRDLTLHIGVTKTGSTSIQNVLARSRDELADQGVCYPLSPGNIAHHLVPAIATDEQRLPSFGAFMWDGMAPAARIKLFRDQFIAEMSALPERLGRCVISSELLSRFADSSEVVTLASFLAPFFQSVKVVVYIRRQDLHIASAYNQTLRNCQRTKAELPKARPLDRFREAMLDYDALVRRYERAFGEGSVIPRIFDRRELVNGDVVDDFLSVCGLKLPALAHPKVGQRNPGLTISGQSLLSELTAWYRDRNDDKPVDAFVWRRVSEMATRDFPGLGWQPTRAEATEFLRLFEASNENVRRRFFPERTTLFDESMDKLSESSVVPGPELALEAALQTILRSAEDWTKREVEFSMERYRLFRKLEDRAAMKASLLNVVKLDPNAVAPRLRLAELYLDDACPGEALQYATQAAEIAPHNARAKELVRKIKQSTHKSKAA